MPKKLIFGLLLFFLHTIKKIELYWGAVISLINFEERRKKRVVISFVPSFERARDVGEEKIFVEQMKFFVRVSF